MAHELHDLIEDEFRDEQPSITEVNGSIARFDMSYAPPPADRHVFGPPSRSLVPSIVYCACTAVAFALVILTNLSPSRSWLYTWLVEQDGARLVRAVPFTAFLLVTGLGAVVRAKMRGVVVSPAGIETREVLALGVPRVRRWAWAQIDRIVIDELGRRVLVEFWDSHQAFLPEVADVGALGRALSIAAHSRHKDVTTLR